MGQSQGQAISGQVQEQQAQHMTDLFNLGSPGFRLALGDFVNDLGAPGQEPASVRNAFGQIRQQTNQQFEQQAQAIPGETQYQALATGYRGGQGAVGSASDQALFELEKQRRTQSNMLTIQESNAAMQQQDFDLSQILGLGAGGFQNSLGFSQNALGAAQSATGNPWASAGSGALSGAATGFTVGGPWGAVAGGVAGGALGYFSGGH